MRRPSKKDVVLVASSSDLDVDIVDDSEPERLSQLGRRDSDDDADQPSLPRGVRSAFDATTVNHHASTIPDCRRVPPWELNRHQPVASTSISTPAPQAMTHTRNFSLESTSSTSPTKAIKRPLATSINRREEGSAASTARSEKKAKRRHVAANAAQFQSAAQLLKQVENSMTPSTVTDESSIEVVKKPAKRISNKLKALARSRSVSVDESPDRMSSPVPVTWMMDSSIEVVEVDSDTTGSAARESEADDELDVEDDQEPTPASRLREALDRFKRDRAAPSSSSSKARRKSTINLLPGTAAEPLVLPSRDRIKVLDRCPLCDLYFSISRSIGWKEGHVRTCALTKEYTSETVRVRVEQSILRLAADVEAQQREADLGRSLFDRTVGKGEGTKSNLREITVVGVESGDWRKEGREIESLQAQLEAQMKKPNQMRVVQEAVEIRRERWEREERRKAEEMERKGKEMEERIPRPTGYLRPDSSSMRQSIAERVEGVLDARGGTGLTQTPTTAPRISKEEQNFDASDDLIIVDENGPPSTQPFAPSALVDRFLRTDEVQVVALPSKATLSAPRKRKSRSRSASHSDSESGDETPNHETLSLWSAAAGKDDQVIQRVVTSPDRSIGDRSSTSSLILLSCAASPTRPPRAQAAASLRTPGAEQDQDSSADGSPTRALRTSMTQLGLGGDESRSDREVIEMMVDAGNEEVDWEDEINQGVLVWDGVVEDDQMFGEDNSSSEEEPLAVRAKHLASTPTKSSPLRKARARKASTPATLSSPSENEIELPIVYSGTNLPPGCPAYDTFSLGELQREVAKYGFRSSKEKSTLVDQLVKVWIAMHPPKPTKRKKKATGATKKGKGRKKAEGRGEGEEETDERSVGERMRELVLASEGIYLKVLRYEPIFFDEIVALAAEGKVNVAKPVLSKWLDEQCITFYTQDPTNGTRRRRK